MAVRRDHYTRLARLAPGGSCAAGCTSSWRAARLPLVTDHWSPRMACRRCNAAVRCGLLHRGTGLLRPAPLVVAPAGMTTSTDDWLTIVPIAGHRRGLGWTNCHLVEAPPPGQECADRLTWPLEAHRRRGGDARTGLPVAVVPAPTAGIDRAALVVSLGLRRAWIPAWIQFARSRFADERPRRLSAPTDADGESLLAGVSWTHAVKELADVRAVLAGLELTGRAAPPGGVGDSFQMPAGAGGHPVRVSPRAICSPAHRTHRSAWRRSPRSSRVANVVLPPDDSDCGAGLSGPAPRPASRERHSTHICARWLAWETAPAPWAPRMRNGRERLC